MYSWIYKFLKISLTCFEILETLLSKILPGDFSSRQNQFLPHFFFHLKTLLVSNCAARNDKTTGKCSRIKVFWPHFKYLLGQTEKLRDISVLIVVIRPRFEPRRSEMQSKRFIALSYIFGQTQFITGQRLISSLKYLKM